MVFHASVVEDVGADLAAPFDFHLACLDLVLLFHAVAHLAVVELRLQEAQGVLSVLGLVAGLGVFNEDFLFLARVGVFVLVAQTHTRLHLVYVLSTSTAATEGVPRQARLLDDDFDGVVDERGDKHRGEGSHTLALGLQSSWSPV